MICDGKRKKAKEGKWTTQSRKKKERGNARRGGKPKVGSRKGFKRRVGMKKQSWGGEY